MKQLQKALEKRLEGSGIPPGLAVLLTLVSDLRLGYTKLPKCKGQIEITHLPRKAVAEVSNHKEPIQRKCGIQLVR